MRILPHIVAISLFGYFTAGCTSKSGAPETDIAPRQLALHFIQPMFDTLDCEHVGVVEAGEVDEHYHGFFKAADLNNSRELTEQEYLRSVYNKNEAMDKAIFTAMDSDQNASVDHREYRNYVIQAIAVADSNRDGELTEQEAEMHKWRKPAKS